MMNDHAVRITTNIRPNRAKKGPKLEKNCKKWFRNGFWRYMMWRITYKKSIKIYLPESRKIWGRKKGDIPKTNSDRKHAQ